MTRRRSTGWDEFRKTNRNAMAAVIIVASLGIALIAMIQDLQIPELVSMMAGSALTFLYMKNRES